MNTSHFKLLLASVVVSYGIIGCGNRPDEIVSQDTNPPEHTGHAHTPQNGGVPIVIGNEEFHLELVHASGGSVIRAYVLDGHMEDYVRISQASFEMTIKLTDMERELVFHAVADRATGETVGDTALFRAEAEWLKEVAKFNGVISVITIRSKTFENVEFNLPE